MIPALAIVGALLGGLAAGWIMRAENGRDTPRPDSARRCVPPYDWAQEPDL